MDSSTVHCLDPRCRLCLFSIEEGERITLEKGPKLAVRFSCPYHRKIPDQKCVGDRIEFCSNSCNHKGSFLRAYHEECLAIAPLDMTPLPQVNVFPFSPTPRQERQRKQKYKHILARKLLPEISRLPLEIWNMVAEYLVHECAAATLLDLWQNRQSSGAEVDLNSTVWARYVWIEGVRYISNLSNSQQDGDVLILNKQGPSTVYILEDHIGVRQIHFTDSEGFDNPSFTAKTGLWWHVIPSVPKLETMSDDLKLWSIEASSGNGQSLWTVVMPPLRFEPFGGGQPGWSVAMSPSRLESIHFHEFDPFQVEHIKSVYFNVDFIICNEPATTGYSACWKDRILTLHAHHDGEDRSFYETYDVSHEYCAWIYFPLDPGEFLTEIWIMLDSSCRSIGLAFRSSKSRLLVLVPLRPSLQLSSGTSWAHLFSLPDSPTRLYFDRSKGGIAKIGIENPIKQPLSVPLSMAETGYPKPEHDDNILYSTASLENVVEIAICRKVQKMTDPMITRDDSSSDSVPGLNEILGILFYYSDGKRACVGQIRMDSLEPRLPVRKSRGLFLGFRDRLQFRCITSLDIFPPQDKEDLHWMEAPWQGKLEWWFSCRHCKISHIK